MPYVTLGGVAAVMVGTGALTVKALGKIPDKPPAAAGLVTWALYDPGDKEVLGHQNLTVFWFTNTYGVAALATLPNTVGPESAPTIMVAPTTKLVPVTVIDKFGVMP
jgi:hypothetical protein